MENRDHNQINKSSSIIDKEPIEALNATISKAWKYNRSLIEASLDPIVIIGRDGIITDVNTATENATGLLREKLSSPVAFSVAVLTSVIIPSRPIITIGSRLASIQLRLYFQALLIVAFSASIGSLSMIEEDLFI